MRNLSRVEQDQLISLAGRLSNNRHEVTIPPKILRPGGEAPTNKSFGFFGMYLCQRQNQAYRKKPWFRFHSDARLILI